MTFDAHAYAINTRRVTENGQTYFKATVAELPHLATYEVTPQEAYDTLIDDIQALYEHAERLGHPFPEPNTEPGEGHSGRLTLRLPKTLHKALYDQAAAENVSLNMHVVMLLTQGATRTDLTAAACTSLHSVVRSCVTSALLLRNSEASSVGEPVGYSNTSQIVIPEKSESWTNIQH